jgi:DNA-binding NtrC family response regulator
MKIAAKPRLLVVDDEERAVAGLITLLQMDGYDAVGMSDPRAAREYLAEETVDILLTDMKMPGITGLDLLETARRLPLPPAVVMITGQGSVQDAVRAMKAGAADYLTKPVNIDELNIVIARLWERSALERENRELRRSLERRRGLCGFVGVSAVMQAIFKTIHDVAPTTATVLITGETGTGKELAARALHDLGTRSSRPFVAVNCAALSEGVLESELFGHVRGAFTGAVRDKRGQFSLADGGTLFLDEIGELSPAIQAKLLRVLVTGEFQRVGGERLESADVRIIAATNKELREEVRVGRFREDLFYRLNVVPITLPPLRERPEDIPLLVNHFIETAAARAGEPADFPAREVYDLLQAHAWPGNVRELENVVERALIYARGRPITVADLGREFAAAGDGEKGASRGGGKDQPPAAAAVDPFAGRTLQDIEKAAILAALRRTGNRLQAAAELGISVRKIDYRLQRWRQEEAGGKND